ncbi:dolichol-phosphate mannosyltransferase [Mucilaginibacter yixingensis]|uniref:Dolichol-phosphate mannosyltransferase n=1 Tax=Mucilaginibacter yixingensis TaxID=1295612 RepID=A0A2T5J9R1_9SPHI|nr:glycosyltransferase family 2 protein [Mucilaginibacter yixingensis]PTQ96811.1 dolichol-phosphate mannosyltransferase [Mucilaginibacter yixingensis]
MNRKLSIVIPCHNEEQNIEHLIAEIDRTLADIDYPYDLILVDDGSRDKTIDVLKSASSRNTHVFYVELSRNFGKDQAMKAGIEIANGAAVITMDADLQHPPEKIKEMIKSWEEGYDIVYTYRAEANPHASRNQQRGSRVFYKAINAISDIQLESGIADFRLMDARVIAELRKIDEYEIFLRGIIKWVGFKQKGIPYTPAERHMGEASYSYKKLIKLAVTSVMAFSVRPLYIATGLGLFFSLSATLYIPYILISYLAGYAVSGWTSLLATVVFFGGIQLMVLGIIGMYLGKLFMQAKHRPNYIIRSTNLEQTK